MKLIMLLGDDVTAAAATAAAAVSLLLRVEGMIENARYDIRLEV